MKRFHITAGLIAFFAISAPTAGGRLVAPTEAEDGRRDGPGEPCPLGFTRVLAGERIESCYHSSGVDEQGRLGCDWGDCQEMKTEAGTWTVEALSPGSISAMTCVREGKGLCIQAARWSDAGQGALAREDMIYLEDKDVICVEGGEPPPWTTGRVKAAGG